MQVLMLLPRPIACHAMRKVESGGGTMIQHQLLRQVRSEIQLGSPCVEECSSAAPCRKGRGSGAASSMETS